MLLSRDGLRVDLDSNSTSTVFPRPSKISNGKLIHLISQAMVEILMSDALQPTQDGGRCLE